MFGPPTPVQSPVRVAATPRAPRPIHDAVDVLGILDHPNVRVASSGSWLDSAR